MAQKMAQKVTQKVTKQVSQNVSQNDPKVMLNDALSALADADEARYAETSIQNAARKMRQSFGPHYAQFFSKKHLMWLAKAAFQFSASPLLRFSLNCALPYGSARLKKSVCTI